MKNILVVFVAALLLGLAIIAGCHKQPVSNPQPPATSTTTPATAPALGVAPPPAISSSIGRSWSC